MSHECFEQQPVRIEQCPSLPLTKFEVRSEISKGKGFFHASQIKHTNTTASHTKISHKNDVIVHNIHVLSSAKHQHSKQRRDHHAHTHSLHQQRAWREHACVFVVRQSDERRRKRTHQRPHTRQRHTHQSHFEEQMSGVVGEAHEEVAKYSRC